MIIIKIGGGKDINLQGVCADVSQLTKSGEKIIIIHGANFQRDELAAKLSKPKKVVKSLSGYESVFSDKDAIDVIMMSYSGLVNKRLVEALQKAGVNAIGLSGIDGQLIKAKKNLGIKAQEGDKTLILRDFSGKPQSINKNLLRYLCENNYVPVLCIPILSETGEALNTENDDIVRVLARELNANKIVQLIEAPGLLKDKSNEASLIKEISKDELLGLELDVSGRIKRKILALRKTLEEAEGIGVYISDGRAERPVKDALEGKGSVVK